MIDFKILQQKLGDNSLLYLSIEPQKGIDPIFENLRYDINQEVFEYYVEADIEMSPTDGEEYIYISNELEGYENNINILIKPLGETPLFICDNLPKIITHILKEEALLEMPTIAKIMEKLDDVYISIISYYATNVSNEDISENIENQIFNFDGITTIEEVSNELDNLFYDSLEYKLFELKYSDDYDDKPFALALAHIIETKYKNNNPYNTLTERELKNTFQQKSELITELVEYFKTNKDITKIMAEISLDKPIYKDFADEEVTDYLSELLYVLKEHEDSLEFLENNTQHFPYIAELLYYNEHRYRKLFLENNGLEVIQKNIDYFNL